MASYDELKVYGVAYQLLRDVETRLRSVPREVRLDDVKQIKQLLFHILVLIYKANATTDKAALIEQAQDATMEIRLRFRLMHDCRYTSHGLHTELQEKVITLSKELAGWHKYAVRSVSSTKPANPSLPLNEP